MSTLVIEIGKRRFVCGLFWQSLSRPRDLRKEAVELSDKISFDLMILRKEQGVAQAGYAHSEDGAQAGLYSLAAAVAAAVSASGAFYDGRQQPVHNWLAAFELPDGRWAYFAVRDDSFLPNGDIWGTKEEVLDRLLSDYGLGGWNVVIGDASIEQHGFHNFNAKKLQDLLELKRGHARVQRQWALRPVRRKIPWKGLALGGLVLAGAATAGIAYWTYQRNQERERALDLARQQLEAKKASLALPHPWPDKPLPAAFVRACQEKFDFISPGGWHLDDYSCTGNQAVHSWERRGSTVGYLLAEVPKAVVDLSGDKATYREDLQLGRSKDEQLDLAKNTLMPLLAAMQGMGLTLTLSSAPPPPAPPAEFGKSPPPKPDWQTFNFAVKTAGVPPVEVAAILGRPGVRVNKLSYRSGEWSIEGVIYAK